MMKPPSIKTDANVPFNDESSFLFGISRFLAFEELIDCSLLPETFIIQRIYYNHRYSEWHNL